MQNQVDPSIIADAAKVHSLATTSHNNILSPRHTHPEGDSKHGRHADKRRGDTTVQTVLVSGVRYRVIECGVERGIPWQRGTVQRHATSPPVSTA